ncbi:MAG TPA: AAA domain-containing protein, partial [Prosthecobacter sp.]|nr:AAA domain-containing protein [Prosthecobacter sp.]
DPCQANAVLASREAKALVVHGPPGTGKSQTITNMIADHLARGERVLFVCDKRTALDVVKYRLDAAGLGSLCGVVHDPSGDRKDFYMGLRSQLENLADTPAPKDPRSSLAVINRELAKTHAELERCRRKLHDAGTDGSTSFHELLGEWLTLALREGISAPAGLTNLQPQQVQEARTTLDEVCRRAAKAGYASNPFRGLLGIALPDFLGRSAADIRATFEALATAANDADRAGAGVTEGALDMRTPLLNQAALRDTAAARLRTLAAAGDLGLATAVFAAPAKKLAGIASDWQNVTVWRQHIADVGPLDRSFLSSAASAGVLNLATVNQHLAALLAWEPLAGSFLKRLFAGAAKKAAAAAVSPLGLPLDTGWQQGLAFYRGAKSRLLLADWLDQWQGGAAARLPDDADLDERVTTVQNAADAISALRALALGEVAVNAEALTELADRLTTESQWAKALEHVANLMRQSGLFKADASPMILGRWLAGEPAAEVVRALQLHVPTLEDMVRLSHALGQLAPELATAAEALLGQGSGFDEIVATLTKQALENAVRSRLQNDAELAAIDGERIEAAFETFLRLSADKLQHVRDHVNHLWLGRQKDRLLATTGTQLNKLGSSLRQRLYVKGKKALKLRQMLATGADTEGGDPIYELCPVWMASPSTVAQIFPRQPIFDVVIFDEASQCRLEEALPVLLRGHRVVIAGDQKQLPPTRFFESALADSGDSDAETAEELFYQQQQEAEDLLTAALNLDVREAYLDVHYRSRNEDLIGFSNQQYYGSRLQPIPGHPRNKVLSAPIQLHRIDGVYLERANVKEAEAAVDLVAKLLAEPQPPSIGVACFNLTQKEAIHDAIADHIGKDPEFARRYEEAKHRKGRDSFEGLFVKNLENVQGDERDVMIISTTFGPDPQGKFRRNFGALSQREGGRRLNVLVTRARDAIHVLTSIPSAEYSAVEAVPPGQMPNGRLQLYAYLRYAEKLASLYEQHQDQLERMRSDAKPEIKVWDSATPSALASGIGATLLSRHQTGSHIHWGNEGFCVDVACIHPLLPADVTVGVLTDFSRFHKTPDPIEWDLFRTRVLRAQGWELERVWSPVLFRRAEEMLQRIKTAHDRLAEPPTPQQTAEALLNDT